MEIFLIVIGILIALQIDNWKEESKARDLEQEILKEIKTSLESDLDHHIKNRIYRAEKIISSLSLVRQGFKNKTSFHDSLRKHLSHISYLIIFEPKTVAFETLRSRGIELISNDSLRLTLLELFDYTYPRTKFFTDSYNKWSGQFVEPFLIQNFKFYSSRSGDAYHPISYRDMRESQVFKNILHEKISGSRVILRRFLRLRYSIRRTISFINRNLE